MKYLVFFSNIIALQIFCCKKYVSILLIICIIKNVNFQITCETDNIFKPLISRLKENDNYSLRAVNYIITEINIDTL